MSRAELIIYMLPVIAVAVLVGGAALGALLALIERKR